MYEETITEADRQAYELQQKKAAQQAVTDTSIQKGAWGQFGSPASGPSVAQAPAPNPLQQARDEIAAYKSSKDQQIQTLKDKAKAMEPVYEEGRQFLKEHPFPTPEGPPKPIPVPTREQSIDPTAAKSLFAVASVIGALGMMGGRGRGMLAMSGMTGMIEGFREGNLEKYKAAKDQYDRAIDQQLQQYHMAHQYYLDQVQNIKDNWAQRVLDMNLQARAWDDKAMIAATESGKHEEVFGQLMDFEKTIASLDKARQTSELFPERKALLEAQTQHAQASARAADARAAQVKTEHPDDAKLGPAGKYYDKVADDFVPNIPTRGELREDPQRYTRLGEQQASALTFLKNAKMQVPKLKELANRVLSDKPLGSIATGLAGLTAEYRESGADMAQMMQIINTLRNEANRLETGGNRALQGMQQQVKEQLPTTHSNKTVAVRHLDTFDKMIDDRMKSILGKSYETEGGNDIRVREKSSGRTGRIPQSEFDPKLYDRIQ